MMRIYQDILLPKLLDRACGVGDFLAQREKVVPLARGRVLEVGMGTGLNLPFYDERAVEKVIGLDPSTASFKKAESRADSVTFPVEYLGLRSESIPLPDASVDTVLLTYTLCSIEDPGKALAEMRRVLKPDGRLVFCEHGKAPHEKLYGAQRRLTPLWKRLAGGCHLDRDIPGLLDKAGFLIEPANSDYVLGSWLMRVVSFQYWGTARARES